MSLLASAPSCLLFPGPDQTNAHPLSYSQRVHVTNRHVPYVSFPKQLPLPSYPPPPTSTTTTTRCVPQGQQPVCRPGPSWRRRNAPQSPPVSVGRGQEQFHQEAPRPQQAVGTCAEAVTAVKLWASSTGHTFVIEPHTKGRGQLQDGVQGSPGESGCRRQGQGA